MVSGALVQRRCRHPLLRWQQIFSFVAAFACVGRSSSWETGPASIVRRKKQRRRFTGVG
jgi:hypothetical protein